METSNGRMRIRSVAILVQATIYDYGNPCCMIGEFEVVDDVIVVRVVTL